MNPWRSLAGLPRAMWMLAFATLINRVGTMALPFLVLYLTKHLGFSPALAGLMFALYGAGALVASPVAGKLCDRFGARRLLYASLGLAGLSLLLYTLAKAPLLVALATLAFALTNESFRPASLTIVGELVPPEKRRQAFSLSRLAANLGMSVGPAVAGVLAALYFPAIFLIDGATSLLAATILFFLFGRAPREPGRGPTELVPVSARGPGLSDRPFLFFLVAIFMIATVFFQIQAAMPLYLVRDLHLSEGSYGLLFTVSTVLVLLLEVQLNTLTARWPHRRTLFVGALLTSAGVGGLALAEGFWTAVVTVVTWTFGEMLLFPAMSAYVADVSPKGRSGEYMGLYLTAFGLSFTVGPALGTAILQRFGGTVLFGGVFLLGVIASAMLASVRPPPRERLQEDEAKSS